MTKKRPSRRIRSDHRSKRTGRQGKYGNQHPRRDYLRGVKKSEKRKLHLGFWKEAALEDPNAKNGEKLASRGRLRMHTNTTPRQQKVIQRG